MDWLILRKRCAEESAERINALKQRVAVVKSRLAQSRRDRITVHRYTLLEKQEKLLVRDLEYWSYYAKVDNSEYWRYEQLVFPQGQVG